MLFVNRVKKMLLNRKWHICSLSPYETSLYLVNILTEWGTTSSSKWRLLNNHCCAFFKPLGVKTPIRFVRDKKWRVTTSTIIYCGSSFVMVWAGKRLGNLFSIGRSPSIFIWHGSRKELEQILNNIDFDNCLGIYISTY